MLSGIKFNKKGGGDAGVGGESNDHIHQALKQEQESRNAPTKESKQSIYLKLIEKWQKKKKKRKKNLNKQLLSRKHLLCLCSLGYMLLLLFYCFELLSKLSALNPNLLIVVKPQ